MILKLGNVAFDCDDVLKVATFWSTVLGRPLDRGSSELWASIGGADPERLQPAWYFNKVPEPKQAKNRVHLDMTTPDPAAVEKLVELGATRVEEHELPGADHRWTVMRDPEGNEFCIAAKSFTGWAPTPPPTARAGTGCSHTAAPAWGASKIRSDSQSARGWANHHWLPSRSVGPNRASP